MSVAIIWIVLYALAACSDESSCSSASRPTCSAWRTPGRHIHASRSAKAALAMMRLRPRPGSCWSATRPIAPVTRTRHSPSIAISFRSAPPLSGHILSNSSTVDSGSGYFPGHRSQIGREVLPPGSIRAQKRSRSARPPGAMPRRSRKGLARGEVGDEMLTVPQPLLEDEAESA